MALAPPTTLLWKWINHEVEPDEYMDTYYERVLDLLDPAQVLKDLREDSILLCWCDVVGGDSCHRRLVAEWLAGSMHIEVPEIEQRRSRPKPPEAHRLEEFV